MEAMISAGLLLTAAYYYYRRKMHPAIGSGAGRSVQVAYSVPWSGADASTWSAAFSPDTGGASGPDIDSADVDIVARTLWGEARGEGADGMRAVAAVIMNRVSDRRYPNTPAAVAQQPWQFSAWNENDPNRGRLLAVGATDHHFRTALEIARQAVAGQLPDPTGGATHYHADWIAAPFWTAGATVTTKIGRHIFYRGVA